MAQRKTLTEKQVAVLRWIADGCPAGVMPDEFHRISAAALRSRGLVNTSGRGPTWNAKITSIGREYLRDVDGADPPVPRQANASVTQQLVDDVIAGGGSLRVPRKAWYDRDGVDYENRARLAERYRKVPAGKRLAVTVASPDELQIELVDAADGTPDATAPVPVPAQVARCHPVVRQFRERTERHEVSRAALPRALRILQGLIAEAERRGYRARLAPAVEEGGYGHRSGWSGSKHGHVVLSVGDCAAAVRVAEEGLPSRAFWEHKHRSYSYGSGGRGRWTLPPLSEYEASATGRLCLELVSGYGGYGRPAKWADRQSWTLEDKLPDLLQELETRAAEQEERRRQAEREAEGRKRAWEAAMERARQRHAEHRRGEALRAEIAQWQHVQLVRGYCDIAEAAYGDVPRDGRVDRVGARLRRRARPAAHRAAGARPPGVGSGRRSAALPRGVGPVWARAATVVTRSATPIRP